MIDETLIALVPGGKSLAIAPALVHEQHCQHLADHYGLAGFVDRPGKEVPLLELVFLGMELRKEEGVGPSLQEGAEPDALLVLSC